MFKSRKGLPFRGQDYKALRKACLKAGKLFVDDEFPPESKSLVYSGAPPRGILWKRPGDIASDPKLFVDGASASDFTQGELGNCWFVAACACLAGENKVVKKILPEWEKQEWSPENKYAGIFHFQFYRMGAWHDVVVDDLLPTRDGQLVYAHSKDGNEFWSALLEKAYAKLFGEYESLRGGVPTEALVDMVGGVGEEIRLAEYLGATRPEGEEGEGGHTPEDLYKLVKHAHRGDALITTSLATQNASQQEQKLDNGLVVGHAYSVTAIRSVRLGEGLVAFFKRDKERLVRLRNPWGQKEWKGAWSDSSEEWQRISASEREELGLVAEDDGEFWISWSDFCSQFTNLYICHVFNTSWLSKHRKWNEGAAVGKWHRPDRAGGCVNNNTFLRNPQFVFDVTDSHSEVVVSLEQEDARIMRAEEGRENICVGLAIYQTDVNREYRMHDRYTADVSRPRYIYARSCFRRERLRRGRYIVFPSTFKAGVEGSFYLRVFTNTEPKLKELTLEEPPGPGQWFVTRVRVFQARDLKKQDAIGGADPYCIIRVDKQEARTPTVHNTLNPDWDWRVTLYKRHARAPVTVEVWNSNVLRDEFMGLVEFDGDNVDYNMRASKEFDLMDKKGEGKAQGTIKLQIQHMDDPKLA